MKQIIIPSTPVIVELVDFIIAFAVVGVLMAYYNFVPSLAIIWIPYLTVLIL